VSRGWVQRAGPLWKWPGDWVVAPQVLSRGAPLCPGGDKSNARNNRGILGAFGDFPPGAFQERGLGLQGAVAPSGVLVLGSHVVGSHPWGVLAVGSHPSGVLVVGSRPWGMLVVGSHPWGVLVVGSHVVGSHPSDVLVVGSHPSGVLVVGSHAVGSHPSDV